MVLNRGMKKKRLAFGILKKMNDSKLLCFLSFFLFSFFFICSSSYSSSINTTTPTPTPTVRCSHIQTQALLLFKHNLLSYNDDYDSNCQYSLGSNYYPIMMNWNTSIDCCNWGGVTCNHFTGDVVALDLDCGMLRGTIHPNSTLFNLPHLHTLNLAFNNLTNSQLPHAIGRFSNSLTHLNISYCGFIGQVPTDITILRKLVSLDLSWNDLKLEPHVFYNLLRNSTVLEELSLNGVNISSMLPAYLNISSMKSLHLRGTGLLGKYPENIFSLPYLEELYLGFNFNLGGRFPKVYTNTILKLDLSSTNLSGEIPDSIGHLESLQRLYLFNTNLSGEIPDSIGHLKSLQNLDLGGTNLSGEIPDSIGHLESLQILDLSDTNLSGEIPDSIGHLESLQSLVLYNTNLSGEIPDSIGHFKSLQILDLSYTNLSGKIPDSIGHLKSLQRLYLSSTNLSGEIPDSIGHLKSLQSLDLSDTNLSGEIPDSIGHLKSLQHLDLHSNMIQGSFPPSICNMSYLGYVDISNNRLGGVLPQCLGNISSSLQLVDFGNNSFSGTIPNEWVTCGELEGLILNGNKLEGEVPSGLSNCKSLKVLDLGNNHLDGTFPHWSSNLQHLQVLVLKANKFHGPIENSLIIKHPFSSLKVLDLSENKFIGHLPRKYFQNFDGMKNRANKSAKMEYLSIGKLYSIIIAVKGSELAFPKISVEYTIVDLSSNIFEGEIPDVIGNLNSLIVLNLSHNHLNGRIPSSLGNLLEIESLDLSCNQLKGEIPKSLGAITTLEVLNLSQNHLVGRIPGGTQFSTFEAAFDGNPGLCGLPLHKDCEPLIAPQFEVDGDKVSGFTWKVVMLGYGCGTLLGLVMGYLMLSTGRPKWFSAIADDLDYMIQKRRKKRRYVYIRK